MTVEIPGYKEVERCTGDCCRWIAMRLPDKDGNVVQMTKEIHDYWKGFSEDQVSKEVYKIVNMTEYSGESPVQGREEEGEISFFTCKNWDEESGNCMDYDNRPKMCSEYPYEDGSCNWEGCTLKLEKIKEYFEDEK